MYKKKYTFGKIKKSDSISVRAKDIYNKQRGYGFIEESINSIELRDQFSGTGGWLCNVQSRDQQEPGYALIFCAEVPAEGAYLVTVRLRGCKPPGKTLHLYTGRRNLVERDIYLNSDETKTYSFYVKICDYIPVVAEPAQKDHHIYISLLGDGAYLCDVHIEETNVPTIFIGGDSIVADYAGICPYNPLLNGGAWGQYLLQHVKNTAVNNQAHGGMTTNCFRDDGHWDIISRAFKPGDIFLFQFGHNDQKRRNLAAFTGYSTNLRWYVKQVRALGGFPVIITPLSRIPRKNEQGYYDILEDHAEACRRVGREWDVPVIDLHQYSFELFCNMGENEIQGYFNDLAHTNDYGAIVMAEFISDEIRRLKIKPLYEYIKSTKMKPWIPDESLRAKTNILPTHLPEISYIDCVNIKQQKTMKEAMVKGLLDPSLKFFHPYDELPRGQFLFIFFKAWEIKQYSPYEGKYCDICRYEFDAENVQAAIDSNLIDEQTTPNDLFRPDDSIRLIELLSFMIRSLHPLKERSISLEGCEEQAIQGGLIEEGCDTNKKVTRVDCIVFLLELMKNR